MCSSCNFSFGSASSSLLLMRTSRSGNAGTVSASCSASGKCHTGRRSVPGSDSDLHFQHVFHCRAFRGISNTLLIWRTNQTHIKTGAAAHCGEISIISTPLPLRWLRIKPANGAPVWILFLASLAVPAQKRRSGGDCVAMRSRSLFSPRTAGASSGYDRL